MTKIVLWLITIVYYIEELLFGIIKSTLENTMLSAYLHSPLCQGTNNIVTQTCGNIANAASLLTILLAPVPLIILYYKIYA